MLIPLGIQAQKYQKTTTGIEAVVNSTSIKLEFYNPATIRIVKSPLDWKYSKESLTVVEKPQDVKFTETVDGDIVNLKSNAIEVALNLKTGDISFSNNENELLLKESAAPMFMLFNYAGTETFRVS